MAVLNASGRKIPEARDLSSFSGAPQKIFIDGPRSLFRLLGTWRDSKTGKKARNDPYGVFWFGNAVIDVLQDDFRETTLSGVRIKNPALNIMNSVREDLAVSYEWNSFDSLIEIIIPNGCSIEAWSGVTKWQLEYQNRPTGRLLYGGFIQYLVYDVAKLSPTVLKSRSLTQLWVEFSRKI